MEKNSIENQPIRTELKIQFSVKLPQYSEACISKKKLLRTGQNYKYKRYSSCFYEQVLYLQKFEFSSNFERIVEMKTLNLRIQMNFSETRFSEHDFYQLAKNQRKLPIENL